MAKSTPGLRKKGNIWHIDKTIAGIKLRESTGETELEAAECYLAKRIQEIRKEVVYGERRERTFDEAAGRFIEENGHKRSLDRDIDTLKAVMPYIGQIALQKIHSASLDQYIRDRKTAKISAGTLNRDMAIIRRVLKLCVVMWRDEQGRPWLDSAPLLPSVKGKKRKTRPISIAEQEKLMKGMPQYLADMALFALHTGLRDQELCGLKWEHEAKISGTQESVFIITEESAKNGHERIVPLNALARSIVDRYRGQSEFVFHLKGNRLERMNNRAWRKAREAANLADVRVHDLRHTFGMRLRAAGVSFEDRQDLLGHHAGHITTHYSKAEIARLIECVELLCGDRHGTELTLIRAA
ncbi:site-specific integrase [Methylicorpusculum oleiharenae]|uniref:tyrosine-type recombinase/integrase n=1 Tax=Methylicorpusculum oleiharenae TaxID=1338687 RepID=UPI001357430F|nr:site-specific integrase [Methylicorpusculum oleiharenae]MCD2451057.1 site-specific integrase [Methylicorpusculum oleiharenae]